MFTKLLRLFSLCLVLQLGVLSSAFGDSKGTEFIFSFQNNYRGLLGEASNLKLYITSEFDTQGVVNVPIIDHTIPFSVIANTITTVDIPPGLDGYHNNAKSLRGIQVLADDEITVYGINMRQYTTDAFLSLPTDALGLNYLVTSYDSLGDLLPSQVTIVSTEDNNVVEITPAADAIDKIAGQPFTITLNKFEGYQLNAYSADLTGTRVRSGAPVAVMSGVQCADVPSVARSPTGGRIPACDHLTEMMPPLDTWGNNFSVVPLATRINGSIIRVLAAENGTIVTINGIDEFSLNSGQFHEFVSSEYLDIEANGPILVSQYSPGSQFDDTTADPFMAIIPPNEQFLSAYTFTTPESGFESNYVNIVVPTTSISSLQLNGSPIDSSLFTAFSNSGLSGVQIAINSGAHNITSAQPFGITVYGFNTYESYGYPGGMDTAKINSLADSYAPNIEIVEHIGRTYLGRAADSEDSNANKILDAGEDINGNGILDRRSEDINSNGILDLGEDINNNGKIDADQGVYKVELLGGASNLNFKITGAISGLSPSVDFRVDLIDPSIDGVGVVRATDLAGNVRELPINLPSRPKLVDVKVVSTVSGDRITVDQSSFTHTPSLVDQQITETIIEWQFETFELGQISNIAFDVLLQNPIAGEQRLVTQKLELSYLNTYGGDRIRRVLGEQSVWVSQSVFNVTASSDKENYITNENALFSVTINNMSNSSSNNGQVELRIEDRAGNLVEIIYQEPFNAIVANGVLELSQQWNTSKFIAGGYQLHVTVKNTNGDSLNDIVVPFAIVESPADIPVASISILTGYNNGGVFVNKNTYHTADLVQIQSSLANQSVNQHLSNVLHQLVVTDPVGVVVFSSEGVVNNTIVPGMIFDVVSDVTLENVIAGQYQIISRLIDPLTSAIIVSQAGEFSVVQDLALSVFGDVTASSNEVLAGDLVQCSDEIFNRTSLGINDLTIQRKFVKLDSLSEISSENLVVSVPASSSTVMSRDIDTSSLIGSYACVLMADVGNGYETIGFDKFNVFNVIANAGNDITAFVGQVVTLDGSGSRAAMNQALNYQWSFVSKPPNSNASFTNPMTETPQFFVDEQGEYVIELIVNNGTDFSRPKRVRVLVPNRPPISHAGLDQVVSVGEIAQLDGSGSSDVDGDSLLYSWTLIKKPASSLSTINNSNTVNPNITIDIEGAYKAQLVVFDGYEYSDPDIVLFNVGNVPPVANAGDDLGALVGDVVTLDGSESNDVNGDELTYRWFFDSVPQGSNAILYNNDTVRPTFNVDVSGEYRVRLTVNDGIADSEQDVVVINIGNSPPIANAGNNQSGYVGSLIVLNGAESSDQDGDALSYFWSVISKPVGSNAQVISPLNSSPSIYLDQDGDYIVQLIVNDGLVDSVPNTVVISTNNLKPYADAFYEGLGELYTGDEIFLNGNFSYDPEGSALTYSWSWVERPYASAAIIAGADTVQASFIIDQPGNYVAQLVVNDGELDSDPVTVLVTGARACVEDLLIRPKADKIQLVWTDNPETTQVDIERSTAIDGPFETIAQTDSTYATYLDQNLPAGVNYYYRIRGSFSGSTVLELQCEFNQSEMLMCGNFECFDDEYGFACFDDNTGDFYICEQSSSTSVICEPEAPVQNSCPQNDYLCQDLCYEYNLGADWILGEFPDFDINQCQAPLKQCRSQVIASTPVGRVRTTRVPSLIGMTLEQVETALAASRLVLGDVTFERTTVVEAGQVVKQDVPVNSVMPPNTPIDIIISTRGVKK